MGFCHCTLVGVRLRTKKRLCMRCKEADDAREGGDERSKIFAFREKPEYFVRKIRSVHHVLLLGGMDTLGLLNSGGIDERRMRGSRQGQQDEEWVLGSS